MLFGLLLLLSCHACKASGQNADTKDDIEQGVDTLITTMKQNILVAYFSRTGENYAVGNIQKGNTCMVAETIAEILGADLFEILPLDAYPEDYQSCTVQAQNELNLNMRPALKADIAAEEYDVIFLGYPVWWGNMPMPVYTFIDKHDWEGKTVVPFCTHEGSGMSPAASVIAESCRGAALKCGLAVRGVTAQNDPGETKRMVLEWLPTVL